MIIPESKIKEILDIKGANKPEIIENIAQAIGERVGNTRTYVSPKSFMAAIVGDIAIEPGVKKLKEGNYGVKTLSFWSTKTGENLAFITTKNIREVRS